MKGDEPFYYLLFIHNGAGKMVMIVNGQTGQVVDWAIRAVETGNMSMTTEYRDGKVKVTIDARDKNNRPLTDLMVAPAPFEAIALSV